MWLVRGTPAATSGPRVFGKNASVLSPIDLNMYSIDQLLHIFLGESANLVTLTL